MEDRFPTRAIPDLRGWLRHSPILGAGLTVAAVATYGLPGWVAFQARADLAELSGSGIAWLIALAGLATLPTYLRLLFLGTGPGDEPRPRAPRPSGCGSRGARSRCRSRWRGRPPLPTGTADATPMPRRRSTVRRSTVRRSTPRRGHQRARRARAGVAWTRSEAGAIEASVARRAAAALRRDRTELLAAAVLALAVLAALTSWGALDIGGAASEAAPIVSGPSTD